MPKALGIVSLIFSILSFLGLLILVILLFLARVYPLMMLLDVLICILALIFGIVGAATSKGNYSKAPSIVGIVFSAITFALASLLLMPMGGP
jgi:hypothetical protein